VIGLDVQQQDPVSKVVFGLAEYIDKQDTHIETLQARVANQAQVQQGSDKLFSLAKAATEAKDKILQARQEQIDLGNEADRNRRGLMEWFGKLLEELRKEAMSDRQRVCEFENLLQAVLDSCKQSPSQLEDTNDIDAVIERD